MQPSHILWNLTGLVLPLLVAFFTVPPLIEKLGPERFGLLALAWGLIGYAGALDLGIGRALTQTVARMRGEGDSTSIPAALTTAARITLITGAAGCFLIAITALLGVDAMLKTESVPSGEIKRAVLLMALALPAQAMSATYRGMNEAYLNFKSISMIRIGLGMVNFGGPFLMAFYTKSMFWLVSTLVVSRILALILYHHFAVACLADGKNVLKRADYSPKIAKDLFRFGGWVTVSSIVSPLLLQADRFVIAAVISAAAVAIYVVPYEIVVQSMVLVGAISSVIFPALSKLVHEKPEKWQAFFRRWLLIVTGIMLALCSLLAIFLPLILQLWLKGNFTPLSAVIGQVLCLGVFANAIGAMYYALLHARGRADLTAKIHLTELPLFLLLLISCLNQFGIVGAAWAWVGRMMFDTIALAFCSRLRHA